MSLGCCSRHLPSRALHTCHSPCHGQPRVRHSRLPPRSHAPSRAEPQLDTHAAQQPRPVTSLGRSIHTSRRLAAAGLTGAQAAGKHTAQPTTAPDLILALASAAFQAKKDALAAVSGVPGPAGARLAADAIRSHPAMAHLPSAWVELVANWEAAGVLTHMTNQQAYATAGLQDSTGSEQQRVLSAASLVLMELASSSELTQLGDWPLALEARHSSSSTSSSSSSSSSSNEVAAPAFAAAASHSVAAWAAPAITGSTTAAAAAAAAATARGSAGAFSPTLAGGGGIPVPLAVELLVEGIPPAGSCNEDAALVAANLRSLITMLTNWAHPTTLGCSAVAGHLVNLAVKRDWHSGDLEAFLQALPQHILARLFVSVAPVVPLQQQHAGAAAGTSSGVTPTSSSSSSSSSHNHAGKRASICSIHPLPDVPQELQVYDETSQGQADGTSALSAALGNSTKAQQEQLPAVKPVFDPREVTLSAAYEAGSMGELPSVAVADLLLLQSRDPTAPAGGRGAAVRPGVGEEAVGFAVTLEAAYEAGSMGELPGVAITDLLPSRATAGPAALPGMPPAGPTVKNAAGRGGAAAGNGTSGRRMTRVGVGQGGVAMGAAYEAGAMGELPAAALCM